MTKAKTKAARRRKTRISLPGGGSVPTPRKGLPRLHGGKPDDSPPPIYEARRRKSDADAQDPLHESDMGRCILFLASGDDLRSLRDAWGAMSAARANYCTRIIGQTGNPKAAAIAMLPEATETDPSLRVDLRTAEQRDEDARRHWAEWQARMDRLPTPQHKWAIRAAITGFVGEGRLWNERLPTPTGIVAVAALRMIAAVSR